MLGIAAHLDGIHFPTDLPTAWDSFRLRRPYRGARLQHYRPPVAPWRSAGLDNERNANAGSTLPYEAAGVEVCVEGVAK